MCLPGAAVSETNADSSLRHERHEATDSLYNNVIRNTFDKAGSEKEDTIDKVNKDLTDLTSNNCTLCDKKYNKLGLSCAKLRGIGLKLY